MLFVFIVTVVRSKCPSYVGTTGILVQEFKHVFKIITEENKLKGLFQFNAETEQNTIILLIVRSWTKRPTGTDTSELNAGELV